MGKIALVVFALCAMSCVLASETYGVSPKKDSMASILHECNLVHGPRMNKEVLELLEVLSKECPSPSTESQSPASLHIFFDTYRNCVHEANTNILYTKQYEMVLDCAGKKVGTIIKNAIRNSPKVI